MHTEVEAAFLSRFASWLRAGCIVEIGSWQGASAIALARGAQQQVQAQRSMVYCIEPHATFVGVYGGRFGPQDRTAFYRAMLEAEMSEQVALVNLPSIDAARAWREPIGLLFIDGDHSEAAVEADVTAWSPYVVPGGYIGFDDALDPAIGPSRVIARLLGGGLYKEAGGEGKIRVLQRVPAAEATDRANRRQTAVKQFRAQATTCGYDPTRAIGRLGYGSFVSHAHRYVYIETPKAACTTMKHLVAGLEGIERDAQARPYHRESRRDMRIHERKALPMPTVLDVDEATRAIVIEGDPDWLVFAVTRNPYSRLVSVFESKVRLGEPGYRELERRYGDRGAFATPGAAFTAFVTEIVANAAARDADAHLRGQVDLLMPEMITYSKVFKVEKFDEVIDALATHLGQIGRSPPPPPPRFNRSLHADWRQYYTSETAAIIGQVYQKDFEAFGYDPADWQSSSPGGAQNAELDEVRHWRAEVVERNAMIDELYDFLLER